MKKITIKEDKFNRLFNYLNESVYDSIPEIDEKIYSVAERFEKYAQEIKTFVEKYDVFYKVLAEASNKLGLVLSNYEDDANYFYETPDRGFSAAYYFSFPDFPQSNGPGHVDLDDETFDMWYNKYEEAKNMLEDEINPSSFDEVCKVRVRNIDEAIEVTVVFVLWE